MRLNKGGHGGKLSHKDPLRGMDDSQINPKHRLTRFKS